MTTLSRKISNRTQTIFMCRKKHFEPSATLCRSHDKSRSKISSGRGDLFMVRCKIFFKKVFDRYSKSMSYGFKLAQTYFPDSGTAGTCNCLTGKPRQSLQLDICNRAGFHNIFDIALDHMGIFIYF